MITEIVSFNRHPGMDRTEMVRDAASTFERWTDYPGLVRKMFMRAPHAGDHGHLSVGNAGTRRCGLRRRLAGTRRGPLGQPPDAGTL